MINAPKLIVEGYGKYISANSVQEIKQFSIGTGIEPILQRQLYMLHVAQAVLFTLLGITIVYAMML